MAEPSRDPQVVRVAAYNVRGLRDDRAALSRVVRAIAPDVLLLQEVPRHPLSGHRIAGFAEQVGMTWADGRRGRMSTTLLTGLRLDLLGCVHHNLPVGRWEEPRGYAVASVRLPGHPTFTVVSVHLSLRSVQRPPHVARILRDIDALGRPAVLGGDLNETWARGVWPVLEKSMGQVTGDVGTSPSGNPGKTIDGLLVTPGLQAAAVPVGKLPIDAMDLRRATDHRPVVADLHLPQG